MRHPVHFSTQQYTSLSSCLQYNTLISPLIYNTIHQSVLFSTLRYINLSTSKHSNTSDSPFLCIETHQFCLSTCLQYCTIFTLVSPLLHYNTAGWPLRCTLMLKRQRDFLYTVTIRYRQPTSLLVKIVNG
jgi:hypothetical protein